MGLYTKLISTFLFSLAWGLSLYTPLVDTKATGVGFIKLCLKITLVSLSILLGFLFAGGMSITSPTMIGFTILLFVLGATFLLHRDERSKMMWFFYMLAQLAFFFCFNKISIAFTQDYYSLTEYFHLLSSCLFLGLITFAMILGHWYLVTPKLSEKPLLISSYLIWILLLVKILITTETYFIHPEYFEAGTNLAEGYMFNWLLLSMRVLWGYVVIGVMSYFSYRLIKMRSIQSATGVLYVMTFFVFVGELISTYLFFKHGLCL
jgi:hypothetical protein